MICGALAGAKIPSVEEYDPGDIRVTKKCLETLSLGNRSVSDENFTYRLECGDSDSTYKFLLPIASACGKNCIYGLRGNLVFTSMDQFFKVLRTHGVRREEIRSDLIKISGRLTAGTYIFPGITDGQALSGLLMALPLLNEKSAVMVEKKPQSEMYVNLTIDIMRQAGIDIEVQQEQNGLARIYRIPGGQHYSPVGVPKEEGDWELAAYWLTGAAVCGGNITCAGMNTDSFQGDKRILKILTLFGASVTENDSDTGLSDITVIAGTLKGTNIDAQDIPTLLPHVLLLASVADGVSIITNPVSLRMGPERVKNLISLMTDLGAEITEIEDGLLVAGSKGAPLYGGRANTHGDYRLALITTMAAGVCRKDVILEHSDAAEIRYPGFFEELERLKG